ncbi:MAG: hypothetical protein WC280_01625 [Patescibacteria group bacterium]
MNIEKNKKLRTLLNLVIITFVFLFAFLYIAPFGSISYYKDFSKNTNRFFSKGNIYKLSPVDRIFDKNKIISDPVYFYLKTFRNFEKAKLGVSYRVVSNNEKLEDIKVGVLLDKDNWNYRLYPIYNNYLNNYLEKYYIQEHDELVFLQKEKTHEDLNVFLSKNDFSSLLLYNYNLQNNYIIENYDYSGDILETPYIKGSHIFYTYIKEGPLKVEFGFKDFADTGASVYVYSEDNLIFSDIISDKIEIDYLPEGVYKVEIKAPDSLVFSLGVYSDRLIFLNKLNLYNNIDGFNFYSNRGNFRIKFLEASCLGDILINGELFVFDQILKQYNININESGLSEIRSRACSFLIENNGIFAFTKESMFDPFLNRLETGVIIDNFDYIIANYSRPEKNNDYYFSEVEIDLKGIKREKDEYQFIISAPFIEKGEYIEINNIKIELSGRSIFDKLRR